MKEKLPRWRRPGEVVVDLSGGSDPVIIAGMINAGFSPLYETGSARVLRRGRLVARRYPTPRNPRDIIRKS